MTRSLVRGAFCAAAGAALVATPIGMGVAGATPSARRIVFVGPGGRANARGYSCQSPSFSSVQAAVDAVAPGGTVVVCRGTYAESVTISKKLTLQGRPGSVIDATGQAYGVGVAASWTTVTGLTVKNASDTDNGPADGIITAGFVDGAPKVADHVTLLRNTLVDNVGAGIDLNSTSWSTAIANVSVHNGIGVNVSNDLGAPASHNRVLFNQANDNPGGCGVVLADHTGLGVFSNSIVGNTANRNGLGTPSAPEASAGSGIILAGGGGGVHDNLVTANTFDGNGHAGVALHGHAPNMDFSGNVISGNRIGTNNLRQDFADPETTGIYLGDASPLTITVVGNYIHDNHYGVFTAGNVTVKGKAANAYVRVAEPWAGVPAYGG
jgi:hypothetical protein